MLASITPLGEWGRQQRWGLTVSAYIASSGLAGAALGASLAALGQILFAGGIGTDPVLVMIAAVCIVGVALELGLGGMGLPTPRRQVSEDWLPRYRGWVYGLGFGAQLGLGVVTIVTSATVYATFALAVLSASWAVGAALGATFGLVRALPVLALRRVTDPVRLRAVHRRMQGWAPLAARGGIAVQCVIAGATLATAAAL